jgi:hypothetical protein
MATLAANGTADLLSDDATTGFASKMRVKQYDRVVALGLIATTAGVQVTISAGSRLITPLSPITSGATINIYPKIPDDIQFEFEVGAGEEISIDLNETLGGTPSVMAIIQAEP